MEPDPFDAETDGSLSDFLFKKISDAIIRGDIGFGAKLSEPRIAARFNVSRGPLREAIRRLEERGLVTRRPRQGVRVVTLTHEAAIELFMVREVLEGLAARQAAVNRGPRDIDALRDMLERHSLALARPDAMVYWQESANADFHYLVASIAANQRLLQLLGGEYYMILRLYRMQHRVVPGRAKRALVEHGRIADAIIEGDGELAELLMRRHIASARDSLEQSIGF